MKRENTPGDNAKEPPEGDPIVPDPTNASSTESDKRRPEDNHIPTPKEPSRRFWQDPNYWIAIATVVTAFAAVGSAIATWKYTHYAHGQWTVMDEQLTQMKGASVQTENALRRELRPYVAIGVMDVDGEVGEGKRFRGRAMLVNTAHDRKL